MPAAPAIMPSAAVAAFAWPDAKAVTSRLAIAIEGAAEKSPENVFGSKTSLRRANTTTRPPPAAALARTISASFTRFGYQIVWSLRTFEAFCYSFEFSSCSFNRKPGESYSPLARVEQQGCVIGADMRVTHMSGIHLATRWNSPQKSKPGG